MAQHIETQSQKTRRIAINTMMLYIRTFITMLISLYTSRVILSIIGVDDFGIYNVVGGVVGLFSLISGVLVNAISRYLAYSLGEGNLDHLKKVFSTSLIIQAFMSLCLIVVGETIGLWFLNYELNVPLDRLYAAQWVFQFSIFSSVLGLMVIPYNACIISHEKMGIYAYFSIIEVVVKLLLVYLLYVIPGDKLIWYAFVIFFISCVNQAINVIYCRRNFKECRVTRSFDKGLVREMASFAGWNFFGNAANVACSQGINIILNLFFGVTVNAARSIVAQVETAIRKFTDNFMTAVNPQITKSYSQGDIDYMKYLMDMSARLSSFLFLLIALPIFFEAKTILNLWLVEVPDETVMFLRLSLILSAILIIGNPTYTVMMATGNIKKIQIYSAISGFMVLPVTWFLFKIGLSAYVCYIVLIINYIYVIYIRIVFLQKDIDVNLLRWYSINSIAPVLGVVAISTILPLILYLSMPDASLIRFFIVCFAAVVSSGFTIYVIGLKNAERKRIRTVIRNRIGFIK